MTDMDTLIERDEALTFDGIAKVKLDDILKRGWSICGYAIQKDGEYGLVTTGAFVGWWTVAQNNTNAAEAALQQALAERDEARQIVRDSHWMAVRYADGRRSYAPGMINDALRKAYDGGWLIYAHDTSDTDLDPQYAREGDKPEYQSIVSRALGAEAQITRLTAALSEANEWYEARKAILAMTDSDARHSKEAADGWTRLADAENALAAEIRSRKDKP